VTSTIGDTKVVKADALVMVPTIALIIHAIKLGSTYRVGALVGATDGGIVVCP
jgi:hypothetical protein